MMGATFHLFNLFKYSTVIELMNERIDETRWLYKEMAMRRAFLKTGKAFIYPEVTPVICHCLVDFKSPRCCDSLSGKSPPQAHVLSGPQLVVLFMEVMEPSGGRTLLGDVCHCGQMLRFCNLVPFPSPSLSFLYVDDM